MRLCWYTPVVHPCVRASLRVWGRSCAPTHSRISYTAPHSVYPQHALPLSLSESRARARANTHTHTHTHTHTLSLSLHTHTHTRPDIACIIHGLAHAPTHSLLLVVAAGNGPLSWRCIIKHTSTQCWGCDRATWRAWGVRRRRAHLSSRCVMLDVYVCSRIMHVHMYVSCKCMGMCICMKRRAHISSRYVMRGRGRERERERRLGASMISLPSTHTLTTAVMFSYVPLSPLAAYSIPSFVPPVQGGRGN
jgi:hypothetical protein